LRTTAPPTFFDTDSPNRGSMAGVPGGCSK
jgi:hypothetical protein